MNELEKAQEKNKVYEIALRLIQNNSGVSIMIEDIAKNALKKGVEIGKHK